MSLDHCFLASTASEVSRVCPSARLWWWPCASQAAVCPLSVWSLPDRLHAPPGPLLRIGASRKTFLVPPMSKASSKPQAPQDLSTQLCCPCCQAVPVLRGDSSQGQREGAHPQDLGHLSAQTELTPDINMSLLISNTGATDQHHHSPRTPNLTSLPTLSLHCPLC